MFQRWSQINETICYLSKLKIDNKKNKLKEHINVMSPQRIGMKHYDSDILIRAFEYFVPS